MGIRTASFSAVLLSSVLVACSSVASGPVDYSSEDSEYRIDYESGMMWAYNLAADLVEEAEQAGSESPRYEGFTSATSQMIELYGGFQEGCLAVVEYFSFGEEFPEGPSRDAWVQGCSTYINQIEEIATSIAPQASSLEGQSFFELTKTVAVESLASSGFQTSLTHIFNVSSGEFLIVDRPRSIRAGPDEGMYFRYFDNESLAPVGNLKFSMEGFADISPDGKTFAFYKDGGCGLGSVDSQREVATFAKRDVVTCFLDFSPDGSRLYFADRGREGSGEPALVRVVDVETLKEVEPFPGGQLPRRVDAVGGFLFVEQAESTGEFVEYSSTLVLTEATGEYVLEIPVGGSNFEPRSSSDQIFFTSNKTMQLWAFDTQKLEATQLAQFSNSPRSISVSQDGAMVAVSHFGSESDEGFVPGWVSIYDVASGEVIQELEIPGVYTGSTIEFITSDRLIVFETIGNWVDSFHVFDLVVSY